MAVLVTGGAGYIGSAFVEQLLAAGEQVVVLDDLSSGHAAFVPADVPFVQASILDAAAVDAALTQHAVTGVIHVAGFKYAGVSGPGAFTSYRWIISTARSRICSTVATSRAVQAGPAAAVC